MTYSPVRKKSGVQSQRENELPLIGITVHLSKSSAIKFVRHRGYDKMLCNHVYHRFCPVCPQIECEKRDV